MWRGPIALTITLVSLGLLLLVGTHPGAARSEPPPQPDAFASGETTATVPASDGVVLRALRGRAAAVRAWREWGRARACLSLAVVRFGAHSAAKPDRSAVAARWLGAGVGWRADARAYQRRTDKLVERMREPGGTSSGTRWAALALWVRWPRSAIHTLTGMIWFESSGRERAFNDVIDCTGLTQVWPKHVTDRTGMSWSAAIRWLMIAENNLREALRIFRSQGNSFLPAWRGDPAVGW